MSDKSQETDLGKLTAYERWELPNLGAQNAPAKVVRDDAKPKLKLPTAQDLENIRKQAYEEGFNQGKQEGYQQGFEEGKQEGKLRGMEQGAAEGLEQGLQAGAQQIQEKQVQLDALCSELINPLEKQQSIVEEALLNVAMAVARAVIHRELALDSSSIGTAIHQILTQLPKAGEGFTLLVNPQDYEVLHTVLFEHDSSVELKMDKDILPGGCAFTSSNQLIDFTIEKRFQKVVQSMLASALQGVKAEQVREVPVSITELSDYSPATLKDESPQEKTQNSNPVIEKQSQDETGESTDIETAPIIRDTGKSLKEDSESIDDSHDDQTDH